MAIKKEFAKIHRLSVSAENDYDIVSVNGKIAFIVKVPKGES